MTIQVRSSNHSNHDSDHVSLLSATRTIFEKSQHRRCYPLEDAAKTLDETYRNVMVKVRLYKWTALALLTLIPILSTVLSVLITDKNGAQVPWKWLVPAELYVSYGLTFLTLLNSIFNPGERFKRICLMGVELGDLKTWALERLEQLPASEDGIHEFANDLRRRLHPYEVQLIDLFLPDIRTKTATGKKGETKGKEGTAEKGNPTKAAAHGARA